MGFARKESREAVYGPVADGAVAHRPPDTSELVNGPPGGVPGAQGGGAGTVPATIVRDARTAMRALGRNNPAPLTASERAFIELRRGFTE